MRKSVRSEIRNLVAHLHHDIVIGILSFRHKVARNIRKKYDQGIQLGIICLRLLLKRLRMLLQGRNLLLHGFRLFLPALLHQCPYLRCYLVLLSQACIELCLKSPSVAVKLIYLCHDLPCVKILDCKLPYDELRIFTEQFESQHMLLF